MAIIVMHVETETNFVLLGAGYGQWATEKPGVWGSADRKAGEESVAYVCGVDGRIRRLRPADLTVVSVDGESPADLLRPPGADIPG